MQWGRDGVGVGKASLSEAGFMYVKTEKNGDFLTQIKILNWYVVVKSYFLFLKYAGKCY